MTALAVNSLTQIINCETEVLKRNSQCHPTFLMVLCNGFQVVFCWYSSVTIIACSSKYKRQLFQENQPEIPAVFQGLACSNGPKTFRTNASICSVFIQIASESLHCIWILTFFDFDLQYIYRYHHK
jgi:hypothetical protein